MTQPPSYSRRRTEALAQRIGARKLIYFGTRGEDALPLLSLAAQVRGFEAYSLTAQLNAASVEDGFCVESVTGHRVDLDTYDLDQDRAESTGRLRQALLASLRQPSVLVPYRSSVFLSSLQFANVDTLHLLGMFHERQTAFEHKPWVETSLAAVGVPTVPWRYVADEDRSRILRELERDPLMVRASRTSGGVGLGLVESPDELEGLWPRRREAFVAVGPYLGGAVPANTSGVVFRDGQTTTHPLSVQLIGVQGCTNRRFGYCGNDYAAVREFSATALTRIDQMVRNVGTWLHSEGYVGAFGIDMLIEGDTVWFTELNPRFQGSTALSVEIAQQHEFTDLYLDHIAAHLDFPSPERVSIADWISAQPEIAQIVCHNIHDIAAEVTGALPSDIDPDSRVELWPPAGVVIDPGATIARIVLNEQVTDNGFHISSYAQARVGEVTSRFSPLLREPPLSSIRTRPAPEEIQRV